MNHGSEHDERLQRVFADEVEELTIGPSPVAAVMRDGAGLRTRRRLGVVSGVAALAVLPVAAVAAFSGGGASRAETSALATGKPTTDPEVYRQIATVKSGDVSAEYRQISFGGEARHPQHGWERPIGSSLSGHL